MKQIRIEIPQYIRKVKLSENIRPRFYVWNGEYFASRNKPAPPLVLKHSQVVGIAKNKKIVERFESVASFMANFNHVEVEYRLVYNSVYVLANPKLANTPREVVISGQAIYSGNIREYTRGKVFQAIKESFVPFVKDMPVIDFYPVRITMEIHDTVKNVFDKSEDELGVKWDIDNRSYPYGKAFVDLITTGKTGKRTKDDKPIHYFTPKLPDDNRLYVTEAPTGGLFVPLNDNDDTNRKLVFIITQDTRPEIINNQFYIKHHVKSTETDNPSETPY